MRFHSVPFINSMRLKNTEAQLFKFCKVASLVRQLGLPCTGRSRTAQYREVGTCKGLAAQH